MIFRRVFAAITLGLLLPLNLAADPAVLDTLPAPEGEVILTVAGQGLGAGAEDWEAPFDLAMLEALPGRVTTTATPWHDGVNEFSGPLASALLDSLGADGATLRLIAINEYFADIPTEQLRDYPVIIATRINGEPISARNNGPLFLIYPLDEFPELFNEETFSRSVWQITRAEILY